LIGYIAAEPEVWRDVACRTVKRRFVRTDRR
jgi:hypothetical protein